MEDVKPWYLSRTIWASVVAILIALAGIAGVSTDALNDTALTDAFLQVAAAIAGMLAIFGRVFAKNRIG